MGIGTFPHYQSSFVDYERTAWDPCATLRIINPDVGHQTCVGYAPSQRRRCRNPIAADARTWICLKLEALASTSPDSSSIKLQLETIAALSLCRRNHQNQVDSIVDQWLYRISLMERPLRRQRSSRLAHGESDPPRASPKAARNSNWRDSPFASTATENFPRTSNQKRESSRQDTAGHEWGQEQAHAEQKPRETGWAKQERRERERDREREQEREQERQREREREREREACAERELQDEKLKQQAAQRKQEERKKHAQMKAAAERKAWNQAWETYMNGWSVFKETTQDKTPNRIPWPVKSGQRADVTEANVKIFFQKAPPDASVPSAMFKIMSLENIRWHPDKICGVFGGERPDDVAMIGRIVIQLRATAQYERKKD